MALGGSYAPSVPTDRKINQPVSGTINGVNKIFTVADSFVRDSFVSEEVFLRGRLMCEGVGSDYVASESGGPGTGYDTITFFKAPRPGDIITVHYYVD